MGTSWRTINLINKKSRIWRCRCFNKGAKILGEHRFWFASVESDRLRVLGLNITIKSQSKAHRTTLQNANKNLRSDGHKPHINGCQLIPREEECKQVQPITINPPIELSILPKRQEAVGSWAEIHFTLYDGSTSYIKKADMGLDRNIWSLYGSAIFLWPT